MPLTLGMLASSGVKTQLAYQTYVFENSAKTTYTFAGVSFGSAEAGRIIVAMVTTTSGLSSGVTIGGVSATLVKSSNTVSFNGLYAATVSSGTSGDIVVSTTGGPSQAGIIVWALYGVNSTVKSSGTKSSTTNYPALSLAAGDIAIFGDWDGSSVTYTNATKNAGYTIAGVEASGASYRAASAETRTVSNTSGSSFWSVYAVWGR